MFYILLNNLPFFNQHIYAASSFHNTERVLCPAIPDGCSLSTVSHNKKAAL